MAKNHVVNYWMIYVVNDSVEEDGDGNVILNNKMKFVKVSGDRWHITQQMYGSRFYSFDEAYNARSKCMAMCDYDICLSTVVLEEARQRR